jgi:cyclohexanecarboxylate-CoA ligase
MRLTATFAPSRPAGAVGAQLPFWDVFEATCRGNAHRTAIVDGDRRLTFGEWATSSDHLAASLYERGVRSGDPVAFQLPNWWETCVLFTAIARLGAIANPLLPMLRERELVFMLQQSGARHLFIPHLYRGTDYTELHARVKMMGVPVERVSVIRSGDIDSFAEMIATDRRPPEVRRSAVDLLLLMYTSGTTAEPKGVLHTNATLLSEVESLERAHGLTPDDTTLMPSPLTHISGVLHGIMGPAVLATTAVLLDHWSAAAAIDLIARERVTYMVGAPIFLQDLIAVRGSGEWTSSLRLFSCGGAAVSASLIRSARSALGCVAKRVYGSTEFPTITTTGPDDADTRAIETDGAPILPNEIRIAGEGGDALPVDASGEIQARGPECFVGYADSRMNADAFTADGWFRTGDIGEIDAAGYLTVTGRIKEIVIRKGEKISIREIEDVLLSHPAVRAACVVGVTDAEVGERLCAAVEPVHGAKLSQPDIVGYLSAQGVARRKWPERIAIHSALPRTESGKVHRAAIVALFENAESAKGD